MVKENSISKRAKDIIQKHASNIFRNVTLEFYGIESAKIVELINVELPVVKVTDSSMDFVFLLEDDTYLHLEFETGNKSNSWLRIASYDLRLYERDGRKVVTVIIYSADVKNVPASLNMGSLVYAPTVVMMADFDGNAIHAGLEAKLNAGQALTDIDMLNLVFLPLMRSTVPKKELAKKSIELAQTIPDNRKREACIASTIAFMEKYLDEDDIHSIMEVLKMSKVIAIAIEEGRIEGRVEGETKGRIEGEIKGKIEGKIDSVIGIVKRFNLTIAEAMDTVQLPSNYKNDVIEQLKRQNIPYNE